MQYLKRAVAVSVTAALIITAPGLPFYTALAGSVTDVPVQTGVGGTSNPTPVVTIPVANGPGAASAGVLPGAAQNLLNPGSLVDPGLPGYSQPAVGNPGTVPLPVGAAVPQVAPAAMPEGAISGPAPESAVSVPGVRGSAQTPLPSQTLQPPSLPETLRPRSEKNDSPAFYRLIAEPGSAPEIVTPSQRVLADPQESRSWGLDSFTRIFGFGTSAGRRTADSITTWVPGDGLPRNMGPATWEERDRSPGEGSSPIRVPAAGKSWAAPGDGRSIATKETGPAVRSPLSRKTMVPVANGAAPAQPGGFRWTAKKTLATALLGAAVIALAIAQPLPAYVLEPVSNLAASKSSLVSALGTAGGVIGNALAFVFPFAEVYKLYQSKKAEHVATSGVMVGFGASMLSAVVAIAVAGSFWSLQTFWGIQNLFSGAGLLAIALLARYYKAKPGVSEPALPGLLDLSLRRLWTSGALRRTVETGLTLAAVSVGVYFLGALALPALLPALNIAAGWVTFGGLTQFSLLAQIIAAAAFTYLMIPGAVALWRTKDASQQSAFYYLAYLLASVGLGVWSFSNWFGAATGPEGVRHIFNTAVYFLSAVPAAVAYVLTRRYTRTGAFEEGKALRDAAPQALPSAVSIEAAVSPGAGEKLLATLDKMDAEVKVLAFDLNWKPFAEKLIELHQKGVLKDVGVDRRQAFTPRNLAGWIKSKGPNVWTVSGLLSNGTDGEGDEESLVGGIESLIRSSALKPDTQDKLLQALTGTLSQTLDASEMGDANRPKGRRGIMHLKLVLGADKQGNRYLIFGSANFTRAAFGAEGVAVNHDGMLFLTFPKGVESETLKIFEKKFEAVKIQGQESTQDPPPPVHDPDSIDTDPNPVPEAPPAGLDPAAKASARPAVLQNVGHDPGVASAASAPGRGLSAFKGVVVEGSGNGVFSKILGFFHQPRAPDASVKADPSSQTTQKPAKKDKKQSPAKPLPPNIIVEAAGSQDSGGKVLSALDKMDGAVKVLSFGLDWKPLADKLLQLHKKGILKQVGTDRKEAFTRKGLTGWLQRKGVDVWTVGGLPDKKSGERGKEEALVKEIEGLIRSSALAPEAKEGLIASLRSTLSKTQDDPKSISGVSRFQLILGTDKQGNRYLIYGTADYAGASSGDGLALITFKPGAPTETFRGLDKRFDAIRGQAGVTVPSDPKELAKTVTEDALGIRHIHGLVHDPALKPAGKMGLREFARRSAPASAEEAQDLISRQFGISRTDLAASALGSGVPMDDRAAWVRIYDEMQAMNRKAYELLDSQKYEFKFRDLANGEASRAIGRILTEDVQKHQIKALFLFPIHLFDSFVLGYFRKALAFNFIHDHEDFLSIGQPGMPRQVLENAIQARAPYGTTALDRIRANAAVRLLDHSLWSPLLSPLLQFIVRRGSLAFFSAISMGVIGGFSVFPFMQWGLLSQFPALLSAGALVASAIPFLAIAIGLAGGILAALSLARSIRNRDAKAGMGAAVAVVISVLLVAGGPALGPIFSKAIEAFLQDIVVGPLLQTLVLSQMLTFPKALAQELGIRRRDQGLAPNAKLGFGYAIQVAVRMFFVPFSYDRTRPWYRRVGLTRYSRQLLLTFWGMITVGAEIEGIMTYAGVLDGFLQPAWHSVTGRDFHLFESIGAAVERPAQWQDEQGRAHKNLVPLGGAITWGNVLLYKAQTAVGFNLSDAVLGLTNQAVYALYPNPRSEALISIGGTARPAGDSLAAQLVQGLRAPEDELNPGDRERLREKLKRAIDSGGVEEEVARTRAEIGKLQTKLGKDRASLDKLQREQKPLPPGAREQQARLSRELDLQRGRLAILDKLAQKGDFLGSGRDSQALAALQQLDGRLSELLAGQTPTTGYRESLENREASLTALKDILKTLDRDAWNEPLANPSLGKAGEVRSANFKEIQTFLDGWTDSATGKHQPGLFELQNTVSQELKIREDMTRLLVSVRELRNRALNERRGGKEMMEFRQKQSQLAMVTELAFNLNKINAAQAAIHDMQKMLEERIAAIEGQRNVNNRNDQNARNGLGNIDTWNREATQRVEQNNLQAQDFGDLKWEAENISLRIDSFKNTVTQLLASIDAEDRGQSSSALAEYQRILNMMDAVAAKRQNNPNDPDYLSVKKVERDIADIDEMIVTAKDGIAQIRTAPEELAGILILLVPGPKFSGASPNTQAILNYIDQRRDHWQGEKAKYQKTLDSINRQLDPANPAMTTDDFGVPQPESIVRMLAQQEAKLAGNKQTASDMASSIDRKAAEIEAIAGGSLPRLSGKGYMELADAILSYTEKLSSIPIPNTVKGFEAKFKLIEIAEMLPSLARATVLWAESDKVTEAARDGVNRVLPLARLAAQQAVEAFDKVLSDGELDRAFIQSGSPASQRQALIDRKRDLLERTIVPNLTAIRNFMEGTLLPYEKDGVKMVDTKAGHADNLVTLYEKKKMVYEKVRETLDKTFPWIIASNGATEGDSVQAEANINTQIAFYQKYLDGWDDEAGHHKGINEYRLETQRRQDPNYAGREEVYGHDMAYSLPQRIADLKADKDRRLPLIQSRASEIDQITAQISQRTNNRFNLQALAPLSQDPNKLRDAILPLGNLLKSIGEEYAAAGGETGTDASGNITLNSNQAVAKLTFDALSRLLPSDLSPDGSSLAENTVEWLFDDGVMSACQQSLDERIPRVLAFLSTAESVIGGAITDLGKDRDFVRAFPGGPETGSQLLSRKIAVFGTQAQFAQEAVAFFRAEAASEASGIDTIKTIQEYYQAQSDVATNGNALSDAGADAMQAYKKALQATYDDLETNRKDVVSWLSKLNPREHSSLQNVSDSIRAIQEKTLRVLEEKVKFDRTEERLKWSDRELQKTLRDYRDLQTRLAAKLRDLPEGATLDPATLARVQKVLGAPGAWLASGGGSDPTQALVIRKVEWAGFAEKVLQAMKPEVDVAYALQDLINDPSRITQLIPGTRMLQFGDDADGFYLVTQISFSTPGGLESSAGVTLGNVAKLWGSNVSVSGYRFASPPNSQNPPFGDQGVAVTVESIEGKGWVNYLDITFHRLLQDLPENMTAGAQAKQTRMMVFEDFAILMAGDRLYIGAAGYGDWALQATSEKPYYYGGNVKTSIKFTEFLKLNAEQSAVFAKDPRTFLQTFNLDFTGFDPALNRDFIVSARGDNKEYHRTQIGPTIDVAKILGSPDAFTVDVWVASQGGTDDIQQKSIGGAVVKGFSFPLFGQTAQLTTRASADFGQEIDNYGGKVNLMLPETGLTVSAEGKLQGPQGAYYFEVAKKTSKNTETSVGYGNRYIGMNRRLVVSFTSSFTLAEIFKGAVDETRDRAKGGMVLKGFSESLDKYLDAPESPAHIKELKSVYASDMARVLYTQEIGTLFAQIRELQKAGAVLDNTRMKAGVGYVSGPISDSIVDRGTGGGFQVGVMTDYSMSKTQKALLEKKTQELYLTSVRLRDRLAELTQEWQALVLQVHQSEWEMRMAQYLLKNTSDPVVRKEAEVRMAEAQARKNQAALRYNSLAGRGPNAPLPFENLGDKEVARLLADLQRSLQVPGRLTEILSMLDKDALQLPEQGLNLMDWIPWVERLNFIVGIQLQDMMSNQAIGFGAGVRLPIYDIKGKTDAAYLLEGRAFIEAMAEANRRSALKASERRQEATDWSRKASELQEGQAKAAEALATALAAYRNGLVSAAKLWESVDRWQWYTGQLLEAQAKAMLALEQGTLDASQARNAPAPGPVGVQDLSSLEAAWSQSKQRSHTTAELAKRAEAARRMREAASSRITKASLDLNVGLNVTSSGLDLLPSFGVTGLSLWPILNLELKPAELAELESAQAGGRERFYSRMKDRAEVQIAVELYQNTLVLWTSQQQSRIYREEILPALEKDYSNAPEADRAKAKEALDNGRLAVAAVEARALEARRLVNFLLDQPLETPLAADLDPALAALWLREVIAKANPVALETAIQQTRVDVARAVETVVDKNLRPDEIKVEPVNLVIRSLGRLVNAFTDEPTASPDLVEKARQQTLQAERDQERHLKGLPIQKARLTQELARVRTQLQDAEGRPDSGSRLKALELRAAEKLLEASLATYETGAVPGETLAAKPSALPGSFQELKTRLIRAGEARTERPGEPAEGFSLGVNKQAGQGNYRVFQANQTLDMQPINKTFVEGWIELRLKDPNLNSGTLRQLADVQRAKGDKLYQASLAQSRAEAEMAAAQFEMTVQLYRASLKESAPQMGLSPEGLGAHQKMFRERLEVQRREIVARLGLDPAQASLETLIALVPEAAGPVDALGVAQSFMRQMQGIRVDAVRQILFDGILPKANEEDIRISKLQADMTAQRMSYKGFTPVFAYGLFRDNQIWSGGIEAPDPDQVQAKLTDVLGDALRREIISAEQKRALSLKLHALLRAVDDGTRLVEKRQEMAEAARQAYQAEIAKLDNGMGSAADLLKAQEDYVRSLEDLTAGMVQLRMDFVVLVADLEAYGLKEKAGDLLGIKDASAALPGGVASPDLERLSFEPAKDRFLDYWSGRFQDPAFAERMAETFAGSKEPSVAAKVKILLEKAAMYQRSAEDARTTRSADIDAAKRLKFLTMIDEEGKRLAVRAALLDLLQTLPRAVDGDALWDALFAQVRRDLDVQHRQAAADLAQNDRTLTAMRQAYWHARGGIPTELEGAFRKVETLWQEKETLRQMLFKEYLASSDRTLEFLLQNLVLDKYLKAADAYDGELIALMRDPRISGEAGDRELARALDTLYDYGATSRRQADKLGHGRGLMALDTLGELARARFDSLKFEGGPSDRILLAAQQLDQFKALKERWTKDSSGLKTVYALVDTNAAGERQWTAKGWLTEADVRALREAPAGQRRIVVTPDGREWYLEADVPSAPMSAAEAARLGAIEVVKGSDIRRAAAEERKQALEANRRERELGKVFSGSDFALAGQAVEALSWEALQKMKAEGRLFYFSTEPDPATGLHNRLHPWVAQSLKPSSYEAWVYTGEASPAADRYPVRESIPSEELAAFKTLKIGPAGYERLAREAEASALKAKRSGFVSLKLTAYGFAADDAGKVTDVYMTSDEFEKTLSDIKDAPKLIGKEGRELEDIRQDMAKAEKEVYGRALTGTTEAERAKDEKTLRDQPAGGKMLEYAEAYAKRQMIQGEYDAKKASGAERDALAVLERRMEEAGRVLEKAEKRYEEAKKGLEEVREKARGTEAEIERLKRLQTDSAAKRFYISDRMTWVLGAEGELLGVEAQEARSKGVLKVALGTGNETRRVKGRIEAVELDADSHLARIYENRSEVERESRAWELRDIADRPHKNTDEKIATHFRIWKYVNPATGNQVYLNREFLLQRLSSAEGALSHAKHYAYLPQNWSNILLEIPRGIAQIPEEVFGGIDMNQQHYIGRVYMYKAEGGATERHGAAMSVIHFIDILNLIPDPVQRYLDPSQFPQVVEIDGPLQPGEGVFAKDPRTPDLNVHFGKGGMERQVSQAQEDLKAYRDAALLELKGGSQKVAVDVRRGRAGLYEGSRVVTDTSEGSLLKAAGDAGAATIDPVTGLVAVDEVSPGHLEVERVRETIKVWPGAEGFERQMKDYQAEIARIQQRLKEAEEKAPALETDARRAQEEFASAEKERQALRARVKELDGEVRLLARLIGAHDVRQGAIRELLADISALERELIFQRAYLKALQDALESQKPPKPKPEDGRKETSLWRHVIAAAAFGIVLFILWYLLTGRGKRQNPALNLHNLPFPGPFSLDPGQIFKGLRSWFFNFLSRK